MLTNSSNGTVHSACRGMRKLHVSGNFCGLLCAGKSRTELLNIVCMPLSLDLDLLFYTQAAFEG